MNLVSLLKNSKRPMKREQIARALRCDERTVRLEIVEAIEAGHPIASSGKGFFYASNRAELQPNIRTLKAAAVSMIRRAAKLSKTDPEKLVRTLDFKGAA